MFTTKQLKILLFQDSLHQKQLKIILLTLARWIFTIVTRKTSVKLTLKNGSQPSSRRDIPQH